MRFNIAGKTFLICIIISIGFSVLDVLLILALPVFRISFGSTSSNITSFTGLAFLRGSIFFLWLFLQLGLKLFRATEILRISPWFLVGINILLLGIVLNAFYIEPMRLTVSRIEVPVPGLSQPVRLVQLSDIHIELTTRYSHRRMSRTYPRQALPSPRSCSWRAWPQMY